MILSTPRIEVKPDLSNILHEEVSSFYDFITSLASTNAVVWFNGTPVFMNELRPDYVEHQLYLPLHVFDTDTVTGYTYNHHLEKKIIHSYAEGLVENELLIQPDPFSSSRIIRYDLTRADFSNKCKTARELFYLYIPFSYKYHKSESDYDLYDVISASRISKKHREFLKQHNYSFYGERIDMDYNRFRTWDFIELYKNFPYEVLSIEDTFNTRRLRFELEVYLGLNSHTSWDGWTKGNFNELKLNKRYFIKYKENGIYLIFYQYLII